MNAEQAALLLAHALPPEARKDCWQRKFTPAHRSDLAHLGVTDTQAERLARILPAIAYYTAQGPSLAAARTPLVKLAADAHKAAAALRVVLEGRDEAMQESRGRLLQALEALHSERCKVDPARVSFFHRYDHREPEALRMLAALQDVEKAAEHALARMPKAQTRAVAHPYPVALIDAALSVDGPSVKPSESAGSPFREIAATCYSSAGVTRGEPLRALRAYLLALNGSPEK